MPHHLLFEGKRLILVACRIGKVYIAQKLKLFYSCVYYHFSRFWDNHEEFLNVVFCILLQGELLKCCINPDLQTYALPTFKLAKGLFGKLLPGALYKWHLAKIAPTYTTLQKKGNIKKVNLHCVYKVTGSTLHNGHQFTHCTLHYKLHCVQWDF